MWNLLWCIRIFIQKARKLPYFSLNRTFPKDSPAGIGPARIPSTHYPAIIRELNSIIKYCRKYKTLYFVQRFAVMCASCDDSISTVNILQLPSGSQLTSIRYNIRIYAPSAIWTTTILRSGNYSSPIVYLLSSSRI